MCQPVRQNNNLVLRDCGALEHELKFVLHRMVRDDIEEQLERGPVRKQEPYYYAAEEELLPSYEDAVGHGVEDERPEGRARVKYG